MTREGRFYDLTLEHGTDLLHTYALVEAEDMTEAAQLTKHLGVIVNCNLIKRVVILKGDK